jgi:serine/threonine-protein kinase
VDEASLIGRDLDGRYRLLEVIGDGGMGRVFRAEQLATGRMVALKLLHSQFAGVPDVVRRFEREAEVTTRLSHPNIIRTIDFGHWDGRLYLAMELLAGQSLAHLLDANPRENGARLTVKRTIDIMRPVLDALDYAHGLGVVHRDLKPDNIMVVPARGLFARESVKLLDFGIARLEDDVQEPGRKLTQVGMVLGTPGYMSPEQAAGERADVRSDIYACGVIVYELLAGYRPFEGSGVEVLAMHLNAGPRSLREAARDAEIPSELDQAVMRALAKQPAERFQSARALREALERGSKSRNHQAIITGVEKTVVAAPRRSRARCGWLHAAVIVVATALLIVGHLAPRAAPSTSAVVSENGDEPERDGARSAPGGGRRPAKQKRHALKRARPALGQR